ncbi:signal peptidase 22kDa subunit [Mrakia frigida]|uniref:signal peptidase complex subunit SPC3 n=1 Tax=Mrakia frigida TaxID=29902 RepID=UPI003FCC12B5
MKNGSVDVHPLNVVMGRSRQFAEEQEYAFATFDVKADLTPLFNWNTKQLFLQLTAEYQTASTTPNSLVLWDKLILSPKQAKLDVQNARNKYAFREPSRSFSGVTNVTYVLSYHLMPYVGFLASGEVARGSEVLERMPKVKQRI